MVLPSCLSLVLTVTFWPNWLGHFLVARGENWFFFENEKQYNSPSEISWPIKNLDYLSKVVRFCRSWVWYYLGEWCFCCYSEAHTNFYLSDHMTYNYNLLLSDLNFPPHIHAPLIFSRILNLWFFSRIFPSFFYKSHTMDFLWWKSNIRGILWT